MPIIVILYYVENPIRSNCIYLVVYLATDVFRFYIVHTRIYCQLYIILCQYILIHKFVECLIYKCYRVGSKVRFLLKTFTTSSSFFDFSIDKIELPRQIHFLLCNTCYWCASDIDVRKPMITQCPSCNSVEIESMPISDKELYKFYYHPDRGITLEFSNL